MDIRFLESFVSTCDVGSLAEAARRLRLTPAAIAQRIHALEEEIGQPLLVRAGRTVRPTPAGQAILERARRMVHDAAELSVIAATDRPSGRLRLGATPSSLLGILAPKLGMLREKYPAIDLRINSGNSAELFSRVVKGALDAAVIVKQFKVPKSLEWLEVRREALVVIVPQDSPWTEPHAALTGAPFVRYDRSQWGGRVADRYLRGHKLAVHDFAELLSLEAIETLVHHGLGVSLIPDWDPPWKTRLAIRRLPLADAPVRSLGVVWDRNSPALTLVQTLAREL